MKDGFLSSGLFGRLKELKGKQGSLRLRKRGS
jgi:hypothetical protein